MYICHHLLSVSKGIVELHGGKISVHSDGEGKGCTFTLELPLIQLDPLTQQGEEKGIVSTSGHGIEPRRETKSTAMSPVIRYEDRYNLTNTLITRHSSRSMNPSIVSNIRSSFVSVTSNRRSSSVASNESNLAQLWGGGIHNDFVPTVSSHFLRFPQGYGLQEVSSSIEGEMHVTDVVPEDSNEESYSKENATNEVLLRTTLVKIPSYSDTIRKFPKENSFRANRSAHGDSYGRKSGASMIPTTAEAKYSVSEKIISIDNHVKKDINTINDSDAISHGSEFKMKRTNSDPRYMVKRVSSYTDLQRVPSIDETSESSLNKSGNGNNVPSVTTTTTASITATTATINNNNSNSNSNSNNDQETMKLVYKLLVVDDSDMNRKMMIRMLRIKSYVCDEAVNGKESIQLVKKSMEVGSPYDAILMDYYMPVMDGPTATKHLRNLGYNGLILGVTGNALPCDIQNFIGKGADHVLTKPLNLETFDNALRSIRSNNV